VVDFFFNCWCFKNPLDESIQCVPICIHNHAQSFRKHSGMSVCGRSHTPELYYIGVEYYFVYENVVGCG
jgi:hypothetical protein